jgi:hypothetical protein
MGLTRVHGAAQTRSIRELAIFILAHTFSMIWSSVVEVSELAGASRNDPFVSYSVLAGAITVGLAGAVDSAVWHSFLGRSKHPLGNKGECEMSERITSVTTQSYDLSEISSTLESE